MLEIKNLTIKYRNTGQKVLNNFSLTIKKGEVVAFLGPSGCGKTTLLNYIQGLLTEKEVSVNGGIDKSEFFKVRTIFQEPLLLPWFNVEKNITFGLYAEGLDKIGAAKRLNSVLGLVKLSRYSKYYPRELSLGMQQRVNFARALICVPDLLLLDEPFSGLDFKTKTTIQHDFKQVIKKKSITTLFVTHDLTEAKYLASRIVVLSAEKGGEKKEYCKKDFNKISKVY